MMSPPMLSACNISPCNVAISWLDVFPSNVFQQCNPKTLRFYSIMSPLAMLPFYDAKSPHPLCHQHLPLWHLPTTARTSPWCKMPYGARHLPPQHLPSPWVMTSHGMGQRLYPQHCHLTAWHFVSLSETAHAQCLMVHDLLCNIAI